MNMTQMTNLGPRLEEHEIEAFEKQIGYALPQGYRMFLLATNGSAAGDAGCFLVRGALRQPDTWTNVSFFYGLRSNDAETITLSEEIAMREELFADGMLPFATDDFGNEICIRLKGEGEIGSVHFWSHDLDVPTERLAGSFEEFFQNLMHRD
jgi:cell wall assembly regulator SMI1